jgi:hypothetical protein
MKILVSWMDELRSYVSREFHFIMQELIRSHDWRHVHPAALNADPDSCLRTLIRAADGVPEAVLFWEAYDLSVQLRDALSDAGIRSYVFADDLHLLWGEEARRARKLQAFAQADGVLCPYAYRFDDFYPELRGIQRVAWIPHSASPDFATPLHEHPRNQILLSGAGGPHYPLRGRMKDMQEAGHPAIAHCDHPGYRCDYDYERDPHVGGGYARRIQQYKAAFTDASVFGYLVAKYFEIPATGALLFADGSVAEPLAELGFLDGEHYISATLANLEERIDYVIDPRHDEEIAAIRRRAQQLVANRHGTSDRARQIDGVCGGPDALAWRPHAMPYSRSTPNP